jgi:Ca-activated chloride channel family protein
MIYRRQTKPIVLQDYYVNSKGGYGFNRPPSQFRKFGLFSLLIMLFLFSSLWWFSSQSQAATIDSEVLSEGQQRAGQLFFSDLKASQTSSALLLNSAVDFKISGMIAHVTLQQNFKNQTSNWVEGKYMFPLPDKAAVKHLKMTVGSRVIIGKIEEKSVAKEIFQKAVTSGKIASLVEQQRPNMFTTHIANIPPGETIEVELEYLQTVHYDSGNFSLRFPMTITPRYNPGAPLLKADDNQTHSNEDIVDGSKDRFMDSSLPIDSLLGWAVDTDLVPDASKISPYLHPDIATGSRVINPIKITADIDMGIPLQTIDSAYHEIVLSRSNTLYQLRLTKGVVSMNQDFVMSWRPEVGKEPVAALFKESVDGDDYFMMMLMPPSSTLNASSRSIKPSTDLPREVIFIIDTSGSMDGVSIKQAKRSLLLAINTLRSDDRFNIVEFNSTAKKLFNSAVVANQANTLRAKHYVSAISSGGGTEMLPALELALQKQGELSAVRQVIFITDGAVGNEQTLLSYIHDNLTSSRLFTVGIGSAPNSYFMRKAAQFGKGSFTHIGDTAEIETVMSELFVKLNSPQMADIDIQWPGIKGNSYPSRIPDLYAGEPLLISVKTKDANGVVKLSGKLRDKQWSQTLKVDQGASQLGVSTVWAREKIASLLDEKVSGRDADEVRRDVLEVALKHQLISPFSSFVAVEQRVSRPITEGVTPALVNNARPKGQGPQSFAYPNTATRGQQSLFSGLCFLLLSILWVTYQQLPSVKRVFYV